MSSISIIEKPDNVDYEVIHEVLYAAHESTRSQGLQFHTSTKSGEEIKEYIDIRDGVCLVALDDDKVIGTLTYYIRNIDSWYFRGRLLDIVLIGTLPEYKGKGIHSKLYKKALEYAHSQNLEGLIFGTAAKNKRMISIQRKHGFVVVDYHYSNAMKCFCITGINLFEPLGFRKLYFYARLLVKIATEKIRIVIRSLLR